MSIKLHLKESPYYLKLALYINCKSRTINKKANLTSSLALFWSEHCGNDLETSAWNK